MKIISFNINGLNASLKKDLLSFVRSEDAEVYCFQEIKTSKDRVDDRLDKLEGYQQFWHSAEKKGYSGTLTLSRIEPISYHTGLDEEDFDREGRVQTLELDDFFLVNTYFPNAGRGLKRLGFKMEFNDRFLEYIEGLRKKKPLVLTGDFNVSHKEKDIARPDSNRDHAGFTDQEREWFSELLERGYIDTFREFTDEGGHYTYWSYMHKAREKNIGWRLDYFVISDELKPRLKKSDILSDVYGSDHCPIRLELVLGE